MTGAEARQGQASALWSAPTRGHQRATLEALHAGVCRRKSFVPRQRKCPCLLIGSQHADCPQKMTQTNCQALLPQNKGEDAVVKDREV